MDAALERHTIHPFRTALLHAAPLSEVHAVCMQTVAAASCCRVTGAKRAVRFYQHESCAASAAKQCWAMLRHAHCTRFLCMLPIGPSGAAQQVGRGVASCTLRSAECTVHWQCSGIAVGSGWRSEHAASQPFKLNFMVETVKLTTVWMLELQIASEAHIRSTSWKHSYPARMHLASSQRLPAAHVPFHPLAQSHWTAFANVLWTHALIRRTPRRFRLNPDDTGTLWHCTRPTMTASRRAQATGSWPARMHLSVQQRLGQRCARLDAAP
jgi:hypothetical protein